MTNRDNILKSRDITLPTKVHLVKAMVFPVVIYGRESWIIKKAYARELREGKKRDRLLEKQGLNLNSIFFFTVTSEYNAQSGLISFTSEVWSKSWAGRGLTVTE